MDQEATTTSPNRLRTLLQNREFVSFIVTRCCSIFATQMLGVAVAWHIYNLTDSVISLGIIGVAQLVPLLLLFPVSGLAADRIDRRRILLAATLTQSAVCCALLALVLSNASDVRLFYGLLVIHGGCRAFFNPASRALLPTIVPALLFPSAIASNSTFSKLSAMAGPVVSGLLLATIGGWVYLAIALFFFASAMATQGFVARPSKAASEPITLGTLLGGVSYIRKKRVLLGAITLDLCAVVFGTILGLLPVFARDILDVGPEGLGIMRAMPAFGAFFVAAILTQLPPLRPAGPLLFLSLLLYGTCIILFGLSHTLWLSLSLLALYGGVDMISIVIRQTMMQLATPDDMRGRVGAVDSLFTNGSEELGNLRSGAMAAALGPSGAVVFGGAMTIAIAAAWWWMFRELRAVKSLDKPI